VNRLRVRLSAIPPSWRAWVRYRTLHSNGESPNSSFLALVLQKELDDRCRKAGLRPEWREVLRDLDRLQEATLTKDGKRLLIRTPVSGLTGRLFQIAGVALPPNLREAPAA
jgi:hypothetical protein